MLINDDVPHTKGWKWIQTGFYDFYVWASEKKMLKYRGCNYVKCLDGVKPFHFRSYADLCWWCGSNGINPDGKFLENS